jgi:hypothetical protein
MYVSMFSTKQPTKVLLFLIYANKSRKNMCFLLFSGDNPIIFLNKLLLFLCICKKNTIFAAQFKKIIIEMENRRFEGKNEPEIVYSRSVKAGKRIYYLDVKKARNEDLYLCITESKRKQAGETEVPQFEKHKVFLYKEDFAHFTESLNDVIAYVQNQLGEIEERKEWVPASEEVEEKEEVAEKTEEKSILGNLLNKLKN